MLRFVPLVLAIIAVAAVGVYDGMLNFRWTPNIEAQQCATLMELVPENIGPWKGQSYETSDEILKVAGAEGYVSRLYINEDTDQQVKIWLIVGPFKHVIRHTPDICYPANEFKQAVKTESYVFDLPEGQGENQFNTAYFAKGGQGERVFWSWHEPSDSGVVRWFASPSSRENREAYAGASALFKLYFTTSADPEAPLSENDSNAFAKVFLPLLNQMILARDSPEAAGAAAEVQAAQAGGADSAEPTAG